MRVVADTNILVSGLLWPGPPGQILRTASAGRISLVTSWALLAELSVVLEREKFSARLHELRISPIRLVELMASQCQVVEPAEIGRVVVDDPDDDQVLAAALGANADAVVSSDQHLLTLRQFRNIPIWTPVLFLERIEGLDAEGPK